MSNSIFQVSGLTSFLPSAERRKNLIDKHKYGESMYFIADSINADVFNTLLDTELLVMKMFMSGFRRDPAPSGRCPIPLLIYAMYAFQKEIEHRLINDKEKISDDVCVLRNAVSLYVRKVIKDLQLEIKPDDLRFGSDRIYMFDIDN